MYEMPGYSVNSYENTVSFVETRVDQTLPSGRLEPEIKISRNPVCTIDEHAVD